MQHFFNARGSTKSTRQLADIPPRWGRKAPRILEKNRNFKIEAEFGGLLGEMFQGFWARVGKCIRGAHLLMCEQNEAGLLSTVPPPEGAKRGHIEKFAPPCKDVTTPIHILALFM